MKQFYLLVISFTLLFSFSPQQQQAQCLCGNGDKPDSVVYPITLDSITALTTNIAMPKFDPATGTLNCLTVRSNVSSVISMDLVNKESFEVEYYLRALRTASISGPGLYVDKTIQKDYGPYNLSQYQGTNDSIHIPLDTIFRNDYMEKTNNSSLASYLGTGTVNLSFAMNGPVWATQGSGNYSVNVKSYSNLSLSLSYYYCPTSLLAVEIKGFTAEKKGNFIQLQWLVDAEADGHDYELQVSENGIDYQDVTEGPGSTVTPGGQHVYAQSFSVNEAGSPRLFFRIRRLSKSGKASYSEIRMVSLHKDGGVSYRQYPNPAASGVNIQFDKLQSGDYDVLLISNAGQVVLKNIYHLNAGNRIQVEWPAAHAPGIYYLHTTNRQSGQRFVTRLIVK